MKFGVILIDPPWSYSRTSNSDKLTGYADKVYDTLSKGDLADLPIEQIADDNAVLLTWATWPFVPSALELIHAWGFEFVTGLPWIKTQEDMTQVSYGVGYWFRGATEPLLVAKRGRSYRSNWVGLIAPRLNHSRKPESIYEIAESYPGPYLEVFARQTRPGWYSLGNECPDDGADIRERLTDLVERPWKWDAHEH